MFNKPFRRLRSANWSATLNLLLIAVLLLPALSFTPAPPGMARVQPILLEMAAQ